MNLFKGRKHTIKKEHTTYYMTATVVEWLPIFTDASIRQILIDALNFAILERKLVIYGYCIMNNHIHLIANTEEPYLLMDIMRNFKRYTSRKISLAMLQSVFLKCHPLIYALGFMIPLLNGFLFYPEIIWTFH